MPTQFPSRKSWVVEQYLPESLEQFKKLQKVSERKRKDGRPRQQEIEKGLEIVQQAESKMKSSVANVNIEVANALRKQADRLEDAGKVLEHAAEDPYMVVDNGDVPEEPGEAAPRSVKYALPFARNSRKILLKILAPHVATAAAPLALQNSEASGPIRNRQTRPFIP